MDVHKFGCGKVCHRQAMHCWHRFMRTMFDAVLSVYQKAENEHQI